MSIKKLLFPSLLVCAVLALILRVFAKPASAKPVSNSAPYDAIDAYVEAANASPEHPWRISRHRRRRQDCAPARLWPGPPGR